MRLMSALGYAGLLPFVALPVLLILQLWPDTAALLQLFQLYSALILGFMAGVIWPVLSPAKDSARANKIALLAVSFPVLSICALALIPDYFLLFQAMLFLWLRLAEYRSGINLLYARSYRRLRNQLTLVVIFSHLLLFYLQITA